MSALIKEKCLILTTLTVFVFSCKKAVNDAVVLTTSDITLITSKSAVSGGSITAVGGSDVTARGICWNTAKNPTISENKTTDGRGVGQFTSTLTGLTANTKYYVRAYAITDHGTNYGNELNFVTGVTPLELPVLTTTSITNISQTSANLGGNITSDGNANVTARGICWATTANPTITNSKTIDGAGTGSFTSTISGLKGFTTYYVRAYATNSEGTAYGNEISFTTAGWLKKASLPGVARNYPVSFTINGKAYIGTGVAFGGSYLSDFWEYDPSADRWTKKADFPSAGRTAAVGFSIKNKGYIGLGYNLDNPTIAMFTDFWEYDPSNNTWTQKASFPGSARYGAPSFVIGDTAFVGTGSYNNGNDYLSDIWMYVPSTNTWTEKANFGGGSRAGAISFLIGNYGYIGIGSAYSGSYESNIWKYNKNTNAWSRIADFPGGPWGSTASFTIGEKAYIGTGGPGTWTNKFYEYNSNTNTWSQVSADDVPARANASGFSIGNIGYIVCGFYGATYYSDLWAYCPGFVN